MTWVIVAAAAALAIIAAAGVLRPLIRPPGDRVGLPADPLQEEREGLLQRLRELEAEREGGAVSEEEYRHLRRDAERRAVAVLRALEMREDAGALLSEMRDMRSAARGNGEMADGASAGRGLGRWPRSGAVAGLLVAAVAVAAVVPALTAAVRERSAGRPITGDAAGGPGIGFFEQRVREHPDDPAARLDLAQRHLDAGDAGAAIEQYLAALDLDPRSVEAHAKLGYLLFLGGRPDDGLRAVDRALEFDPTYPEALFFRGVILLEGLDRPAEASEALRSYLEEAPFGSFREDAAALLDRAEGSASG